MTAGRSKYGARAAARIRSTFKAFPSPATHVGAGALLVLDRGGAGRPVTGGLRQPPCLALPLLRLDLRRGHLPPDPRRPRPATPQGHPGHGADHPRVFATLTAPSFGPVHNRPASGRCRCGTPHPDEPRNWATALEPGHVRLRGRGAVEQPRRAALAALHDLAPPRDRRPRRHHPSALLRNCAGLLRQGRRVPEARRDPLPRRGPPRRSRRARHDAARLGQCRPPHRCDPGRCRPRERPGAGRRGPDCPGSAGGHSSTCGRSVPTTPR